MIRRRSLFLTLFLTFGLLLGMTSQAFAKGRDKDDLARVLAIAAPRRLHEGCSKKAESPPLTALRLATKEESILRKQ